MIVKQRGPQDLISALDRDRGQWVLCLPIPLTIGVYLKHPRWTRWTYYLTAAIAYELAAPALVSLYTSED